MVLGLNLGLPLPNLTCVYIATPQDFQTFDSGRAPQFGSILGSLDRGADKSDFESEIVSLFPALLSCQRGQKSCSADCSEIPYRLAFLGRCLFIY